MIELIVIGNEITTKGYTYLYIGYEIVDDYSVLLIVHNNNFNLVAEETIINGKLCKTIEEIISNFNNL
jgi:hypothetical protein